MKKLFAVFCAICLMPTFSAQAWIGGPFSNNSFFEPGGDDGVYEASATTTNGIGLFRFVVGNDFDGVNPQGVNSSVPSEIPNSGNIRPLIVPGISSGNIVIGGLANPYNNVWFYRGVQYFGSALGTANSAVGMVIGFGAGFDQGGRGVNSIETAFRARFVTTSLLPSTAFQGVGNGQTSFGETFRFTVFGSRVSTRITFGL